LNEKLEQVERYVATEGKEGIGRLIVTLPPRHGKSEKVSIRFPAWFLGRNPDKKVVQVSYGAELAEDFSRQVRSVIEGPEFQVIFGKTSLRALTEDGAAVSVDPERRKLQSWDIGGRRGGLTAVGVGGALTGRGADLLIIDDPIKNSEEADSEVMRDKVWDFYTSVAYTRLHKGAAVIVMCTRWHEDDLVGRILEQNPGNWTVINLPAFAEDNDPLKRPVGEPLWPERFDAVALNDTKSVLTPRQWNALYQQRPTSAEGDVFQEGWFRYGRLPHPDEITRGIQIWDTALTEKEESDYSACVTAYVTKDGLFIADVYRAHLNFPDLKQKMYNLHEHWSNHFPISRVMIEDRVSGTSVLQALRKESALPVMPLDPLTEIGKSKLQRAQAASGYVQAGRVILREGAPYLGDFMHEILSFPRGKHDDMCLVPGTMVETSKGPKTIEDILPGELVSTRRGLRRVVAAGMTNPSAHVITASLSDGTSLTGTPNHPVWVEGAGFTRLDSLVYGDIMFTCKNKKLKSSNWMGCASAATRTVLVSITGGISRFTKRIKGLFSTYIDTFGKKKMDRSPRVITSTIQMKTPSTMISQIWSALHLPSTGGATGERQKECSDTWNPSGLQQASGTEQKQEKGGTGNMADSAGREERGLGPSAPYAKKNSLPSFPGQNFAPEPAAQKTVDKAVKMTKSVLASIARRLSPEAASERQDTAPVFVVGLREEERRSPVYSLAVEGAPEYFANGVLTHNCDALVYAILQTQGGGKSKKRAASLRDRYGFLGRPADRHSKILGAGWGL